MKQRNIVSLAGFAQTTLWAAIIVCHQSVLTAVPTITIFSDVQSVGLCVEGIVVSAPDTLHRIEISGLEEMLATAEGETMRRSRLFSEDAAALVGDSLPGGISEPRQDLDYIMFSPSLTGGTPAHDQLTSDTAWPEVTSVCYDAIPWLPRRY